MTYLDEMIFVAELVSSGFSYEEAMDIASGRE